MSAFAMDTGNIMAEPFICFYTPKCTVHDQVQLENTSGVNRYTELDFSAALLTDLAYCHNTYFLLVCMWCSMIKLSQLGFI